MESSINDKAGKKIEDNEKNLSPNLSEVQNHFLAKIDRLSSFCLMKLTSSFSTRNFLCIF